MMKYKAGDRVRIRSDLIVGVVKYSNCFFNGSMARLKGKICTIFKVYPHVEYYELREDVCGWNWTDDMFEGLESNFKFKTIKREVIKNGKI